MKMEYTMEGLRKIAEAYYMDYVNSFLTEAEFADYHGITETEAHYIIMLGKVIHWQEA